MSGKYVRVGGMKIDNLPSNLDKEELIQIIEDIERLADFIGNAKTLSKSISNFFKKNNDIHSWNVASLVLFNRLEHAEKEYTRFHTDFFEYLMEGVKD